MRSALALAALFLAACSARPPEASDGALLDLWAAAPVGTAALAQMDAPASCEDAFGSWSSDYGVRGLACATHQSLELATALRRAPTQIWTSAPHRLDADGLALDLTSDAFGHYDPAFVEWAVANAVPRTEAARRIAQPVYDRYVRRLARIYWLTLRDLDARGFPEAVPPGEAADYAAYLETGRIPEGADDYQGGVSMHGLFGDRSLPIAERLVGPNENVWELRYEANTAYGFWVRRQLDGTAGTFREGLSELLETLDAEWLADIDP